MTISETRAEVRAFPFGLIDLALLGVAVVWGINFVVIKAAVTQFQPLAFTALRFTLASASPCSDLRHLPSNF